MEFGDIPLRGERCEGAKLLTHTSLRDLQKRPGRSIIRPMDYRNITFHRCPHCGELMAKLPCSICQLNGVI